MCRCLADAYVCYEYVGLYKNERDASRNMIGCLNSTSLGLL